MIDAIIEFGATRTFGLGLFIGFCCGGSVFGIIGWCVGYDQAIHKVGEWLKPKNREAETYGDMPTLPPAQIPPMPPTRAQRLAGDVR